jgi:hypothetical protein
MMFTPRRPAPSTTIRFAIDPMIVSDDEDEDGDGLV